MVPLCPAGGAVAGAVTASGGIVGLPGVFIVVVVVMVGWLCEVAAR